jgi:hypothetical protein
MKKLKYALVLGIAGLIAATAHAQFSPRNLAVLRAGDNGTSAASDILAAHQTPIFVDQYDPVTPIVIPGSDTGTNGPVFSVAIPTNDPAIVPPYQALWFNGHAGTEGYLALSGDSGTLAFSGYGGDILAVSGTPSGLNIPRGICVINQAGNTYIPYEGSAWYGLGAGSQTNPRGAVSDNGTNNFFGSGSLDGNEWYTPSNPSTPESIQNLGSTRAVKIINGVFYTSLQGNDGGTQYPPGIYNYSPINSSFQLLFPVALPEGDIFFLNLVVPASPLYPNVESFDLNPQRNIAYTADSTYGIQKYIEVGGNWVLACAFGITNNTSPGVTSFPASYTGCFGLVVDWTGSYPVVFATTTEGNGGYANANRLIRLDDDYNFTDGQLHTNVNVTTLATGWSQNIAFRGLAWTPDLAPVITANPASQSVVSGKPVTFTVAATAKYPDTYEWLVNGSPDLSQTTSNYNVASASADGAYQVIVSNAYGAVTSAVASLTVTLSQAPPVVTSPVPALNLTNAVFDSITIPVTASGTTPLSYQWWQGATRLSDSGDFSGTATGTLAVNISSGADAGNYYVVVNNGFGSPSSNLVATVTIITPLPFIFDEPPANVTVASNGTCTFAAQAFPLNATYQWFQGTTALTDNGHWSGSKTSALTDLDAVAADATTYTVVATDAEGSVTSSVVTLTVATPAPFSSMPYTSPGMVYTQNFDTMPDPGVTSVNNSTGKEVTINGINYFVGNPFDFAAPPTSGSGGGLGLGNMAGWFSSDLGNEQIQATTGDNTTGLIVSFGCTNAVNTVNPLYPTNNRALGIISSPATSGGGSAGNAADAVFALRLLNVSGQTLTNLNLSYVSELWRNTLVSNAVGNYYYVDPLGTNNTPTNNSTGFLTTLLFPTNSGTLPSIYQKSYGTNAPLATNQISFVNLPLAAAWPQGGILWIVWEETNAVSGGQGIGIDNLVFSSGPPSLAIEYANSMVTLYWPAMFTAETLQSNSKDISQSADWLPVSLAQLVVTNGINTLTLPVSDSQQYFRLSP